MTVSVIVVVRFTPYGNPASLGEPFGIFAGEADVTGDASGGFVAVSFTPQVGAALPDDRRRYLLFVDGATISSPNAGGDPGNLSAEIFTHWARANTTLADRFTNYQVRDSLSDGIKFAPDGDLVVPYQHRTPIFWDTQELSENTVGLVVLAAQTNLDGIVYEARCWGRYYDRQLLSNRSFGRLISPPPLAPFD